MSDLTEDICVPVLVLVHVEVVRGRGAPGGQRGQALEQVNEFQQSLASFKKQDLLSFAHNPQLSALGFQTVSCKLMLDDEVIAELGERHGGLDVL